MCIVSVIGVGLKPGTVVTFRDVKTEIVEKNKYEVQTAEEGAKKEHKAIKIENIRVDGDKITDEMKFIVIQANHGAHDVHIAPYPATDVPAKAKLADWCKKDVQKKSFSYQVVLTPAEPTKNKDKPFPVPRTMLKKADQDEQITE